MEIKPIKTKADYQATLEEIEKLFDAAPDTPEGDRLEVLVEHARSRSRLSSRRIRSAYLGSP